MTLRLFSSTIARWRRARTDHLDRLFVVDGRNLLRGALSLQSLLVAQSDMPVADIMERESLAFRPPDSAHPRARV